MFEIRKSLILEEMSNAPVRLPDQFFIRHCILLTNSFPYLSYSDLSTLEKYDDICWDGLPAILQQVCFIMLFIPSKCPQDNVHLSFIGPRSFPEIEKMCMAVFKALLALSILIS
jgi:hypothetical protein